MRRKDREIRDTSDILKIIASCDVCRLAFADNNVPYIVTLNFGYSGSEKQCLYFHCATSGRKLEMMKKNNYVCFEMDTDHSLTEASRGCDWGMKYSSIIGYGSLHEVTDRAERIKGLDAIMFHYSGRNGFEYDDKIMKATMILRLDIEVITAKRKT